MDSVSLELLAQSLAAPRLAPLRFFVLATWARHYLGRAHIAHVSNERAAVATLRFVQVGRGRRPCMGLRRDA